MTGSLWINPVGDIIVARMRGEMTVELLQERHQRILQIESDTGYRKLLVDDLEMAPLSYPLIVQQQALNADLEARNFRIAILVPNSTLAFFARIQFGGQHHEVFYNDMPGALHWLSQGSVRQLG